MNHHTNTRSKYRQSGSEQKNINKQSQKITFPHITINARDSDHPQMVVVCSMDTPVLFWLQK